MTLVLYSKRKSSITAPAPLATKLISKQVRLNATKSVLVDYEKVFDSVWQSGMIHKLQKEGRNKRKIPDGHQIDVFIN